MQTRRTTTRENQWGDNEEEEVSKAPEGPALGYYYSNGPAWTAGAARWRSILQSFFFFFFWTGESPHYGLQPLYFLRTAGGPAPPSGFYWILSEEWTLMSPSPQQFMWPEYMQINCCFSNSSAYWGRTWCIYRYVGPTPAGRPALLWWIWWSWIDSSIQHRSSTGSPFPWIDQKRMGVCMNMDAAWLAWRGGGIFSHLLYHCKRITHRSKWGKELWRRSK